MKKSFTLTAAIAATASVLAPAPAASAAAGGAPEKPVLTQVKTTVTFDFAAGESAENITAAPDGSLTISQIGITVNKPPKLVRVSPSGRSTVLATAEAGDGILGNTRGPDGTLYYNVLSADAARSGVWAIPPGGTAHRVAALPTDSFPNGLAIDPSGRTLYVTDSKNGTVLAVAATGGTAAVWASGAALTPTSTTFPLGANGLRFHNGALWVSNTDQGKLLRIPVTATGKAGQIHVVSGDVAGIDDFNFLNARSNTAFVALNGPNEIAVVYPDGSRKTVLTSADGLTSPTATAVRGKRLYITDAGFAEPNITKLQQAQINLSALFRAASS